MIPKLHYITNEINNTSYKQLVNEVCLGGATLVQLRIKNKNFDEWLEIANDVKKVCDLYNTKLIINDNVYIAKEINCYGVHLGKTDMHPSEARKILGSHFIIGGTANCFNDIKLLYNHIDYIGLGPYQFTTTKQQLSPILGINGYIAIIEKCKQTQINTPIIAIGGITINDVKQLMNTGVYGIAVSSAINNRKDRTHAVKQFLEILN